MTNTQIYWKNFVFNFFCFGVLDTSLFANKSIQEICPFLLKFGNTLFLISVALFL